jgi:hypothetical protein
MTDPKTTETDDTEGNGFHYGGVSQDAPTDDTEGNNARIFVRADGVDTEGDDSEGNCLRVGG